jgi:hypothetical protein
MKEARLLQQDNYDNCYDSSDKGEGKKKYCFGDKKKKKFWKMISRACAVLNDLDFSSNNASSLEEDEKPKCKTGNFTGLCLMGKSSRHISDSDVSDDSSPESLSLRAVKLENAFAIKTSCFARFFVKTKS